MPVIHVLIQKEFRIKFTKSPSVLSRDVTAKACFKPQVVRGVRAHPKLNQIKVSIKVTGAGAAGKLLCICRERRGESGPPDLGMWKTGLFGKRVLCPFPTARL